MIALRYHCATVALLLRYRNLLRYPYGGKAVAQDAFRYPFRYHFPPTRQGRTGGAKP